MTDTTTPADPKVLVVDDAPEVRELLVPLLEQERFTTAVATDGNEALTIARELEPDLVVLDISLPGLDGVEVCRRLRAFSDAYVIMLTSRADEVDKLVGLSVGADDYLTKPFSPRELIARLRAMLRRPRAAASTEIPAARRFGPLSVDTAAREVRVHDAIVDLTPLEFGIIELLSSNARVVFTREQLLERVWGPGWFGDDHVIDVHMSNLRRKLSAAAPGTDMIRTVRGVGYRLQADRA